MIDNFRWRRWGSSLPGLRTLDPPLSPPSTPAEMFRRTCLHNSFKITPKGGGDVPQILFTSKLFFCLMVLNIWIWLLSY